MHNYAKYAFPKTEQNQLYILVFDIIWCMFEIF